MLDSISCASRILNVLAAACEAFKVSNKNMLKYQGLPFRYGKTESNRNQTSLLLNNCFLYEPAFGRQTDCARYAICP